MKAYVEIQGHTDTPAQFLARCRAALRKTGLLCYIEWANMVSGAWEEMSQIAKGEREKYHHPHRADEERPFHEICSASATSYQCYLDRKDEPVSYNFILEWDEGFGYFYCFDSAVSSEMSAIVAR